MNFVVEQLEKGIVRTLLKLSKDKNAKTHAYARCLFISVCDFDFVLGLLNVILCSTSDLSRYLRDKSIDVISATGAAELTIKSLRIYRTDEGFEQLWSWAKWIKEWIEDWLRFSFRETTAPRSRQVSRRLLSFAGEAAEEQPVPWTDALSPSDQCILSEYETNCC